jgi:hypothetical protein
MPAVVVVGAVGVRVVRAVGVLAGMGGAAGQVGRERGSEDAELGLAVRCRFFQL